MGKKDKKKGKGAEKTNAKTEKKHTQKLKKELALKGEEDIESLLAKFADEDSKKLAIVEELVPPPGKRSSFSMIPHPDKDQLILFGGEYFNGNKTYLYNDLFFYNVKQDRWLKVTSPGGPPPLSGHQMVAVSQNDGELWVFGGEFTSLTQSQFYHYKDLWVFHMNKKIWEKINAIGGPSSRSGHRMVASKKQLVVFGGFHDNLREYKYYNDVYAFSLESYTWTKLEVAGLGPTPRSACQMCVVSDGRILVYGGYSKEKVKKDVDKGILHTDMFLLTPDKHDISGTKWKWNTVKAGGVRPSPRCGMTATMAGNDRAVAFGGVYDEENDDALEGSFFDDLYQLDLITGTWHLVNVKGTKENVAEKKRRRRKSGEAGEREYEEDTEKEEMEEKLENLKVEGPRVVSDDGVFTVTIGPSKSASAPGATAELCTDVFCPPPRINAGLAVKKGILYLYGGMYEEGDRQLTLNDFYSLDLSKLDEWKTIIALNSEDMEWFDSDSGSDSESDDDEDMEESEEEDGMDTQ